jgi:hypothetical protein
VQIRDKLKDHLASVGLRKGAKILITYGPFAALSWLAVREIKT